MTEAIKGLFTSAPGLERVNLLGLGVMLIAVIISLMAKKISLRFPEEKQNSARIIAKLLSLIICVIGFVIAIY